MQKILIDFLRDNSEILNIRYIERMAKMPKTSLNKVIAGTRELCYYEALEIMAVIRHTVLHYVQTENDIGEKIGAKKK